MFKIGDRVRVREDLIVSNLYNGHLFTEGMQKFTGKEYIIKDTSVAGSVRRYSLDGTNNYAFTNGMLEAVEKEEETICKECKYNVFGCCKNTKCNRYGLDVYGFTACSNFEQLEPKETIIEEIKLDEQGKVIEETVDHPSHYNQGIEAIDVIESWDLNFSLGNAIKYILRAPHKHDALEDLKKARWYVNREIERIEKLAKEESLVL